MTPPSHPPSTAAEPAAAPAATRGTRRRRALFFGVAALAAMGGAGTSVWRRPPDGDLAPEALWQLQAERPEGGSLALADLRGAPLLLNFWATWCAPCVREMPLLSSFHRAQGRRRGWATLGLAVDRAEAVRGFLQRSPVSYPVALAGIDGLNLLPPLGNPQGGLPFSLLVGADGRILQRHLGELTATHLEAWAGR